MVNMSMRWEVPTPFQPNAYVNLTCVSINSRPPAILRWFRGVHEVTHSSTNNQRVTRQNGNFQTLLIPKKKSPRIRYNTKYHFFFYF